MKYIIVSFFIGIFSNTVIFGQEIQNTPNFAFDCDGNTLSGFIDMPTDHDPSAIVILVPGHGPTDFAHPDPSYAYIDSIRHHFLHIGLACCLWDKPGCGQSDGEYDNDQTIQSSTKEVLAAIEELKRRGVPGSDNIGFWGISRAGWICPLVIEAYPSTAFWISVSGTDHTNSSLHQLFTRLITKGKSESEAHLLVNEKKQANRVFWRGGSFEEYAETIKTLNEDPDYVALYGKETREGYLRDQQEYVDKGYLSRNGYAFDDESGMIVMVPGFENVLREIHCPVLAIFGELDTQVDWQRTIPYYKKTIGVNPNAELKIVTYPEGDHLIVNAELTGQEGRMHPCNGYYETMTTWLIGHGFGSN